MSLPLEPVLAQLDANREPAVERWKELLRIPSIGTDPARDADTRRAAEWLVGQPALDRLRGVAARRPRASRWWSAHHPGPDGAGAPAPPLLRPLRRAAGRAARAVAEPALRADASSTAERGPRVVARGAVDDKGQVMTWIEALRAWHDGPRRACRSGSRVFLEGEEESGSPSLVPFLEAQPRRARGRRLRGLRHRHVGHRHAGDHVPCCAAWSTSS